VNISDINEVDDYEDVLYFNVEMKAYDHIDTLTDEEKVDLFKLIILLET
jgi:hypothetical protein